MRVAAVVEDACVPWQHMVSNAVPSRTDLVNFVLATGCCSFFCINAVFHSRNIENVLAVRGYSATAPGLVVGPWRPEVAQNHRLHIFKAPDV